MTDFNQTQPDVSTELGQPELSRTGEFVRDKKLVPRFVLDGLTYDSSKGLETNFMVRGSDTTAYASVTVFSTRRPGFKYIRTTTAGNATFNMTTPGYAGQELYMKIDNDTDANRTITFGNPFKVSASLIGSTASSAVLHFISDGTNFWEVSRATGINQL